MENTKKRKKLGLALGAGAFRGVCHIGVIEALEEHGIEIDVVTGCSMGAVIGGSYAAGIPIAEIKNTILAIKRKGKLIDFNIFTPRKGAVSGKKIHAFLNES
ncbi:MAG: patatin-like phospholipase family protein, partial [Firmicutes bacterium]|nr:patatin-like phospholipase family protein [Bacillota bacterium]